jgi:protein required for attachment to host cells
MLPELVMQLPKNATVAVADGENFNLFRNAGDEADLKLVALAHDEVEDQKGAGAGHHGSSANPDGGHDQIDAHSAGMAELLNRQVLGGKISHLLVIAAPRTLGALRPHYHAKLSELLVGEISKDLTGLAAPDLEKAIAAA